MTSPTFVGLLVHPCNSLRLKKEWVRRATNQPCDYFFSGVSGVHTGQTVTKANNRVPTRHVITPPSHCPQQTAATVERDGWELTAGSWMMIKISEHSVICCFLFVLILQQLFIHLLTHHCTRMWGSVWRLWMRSVPFRWRHNTCRNTVNSSPLWKRWSLWTKQMSGGGVVVVDWLCIYRLDPQIQGQPGHHG